MVARSFRTVHRTLFDNEWTSCGYGMWLRIEEDVSDVGIEHVLIRAQEVSTSVSVQHPFVSIKFWRKRAHLASACVQQELDQKCGQCMRLSMKEEMRMCGPGSLRFWHRPQAVESFSLATCFSL